MVSKSFYPLGAVGAPADVKFEAWANAPVNAAMLAFGNLGVTGNNVQVQGWLYDVKNTASPQVLGKQYSDVASDDNVRTIAHKFADEIIFRLGGGIQGIAESKIFFVSNRTGHKEIWMMDYDGQNQHALTHLGGIALSPQVSPGWFARCFQFAHQERLGHLDVFDRVEPHRFVSALWRIECSRPLGLRMARRFAFSSSRTEDPEIYTVDAAGAGLKRLTAYKGPDIAPTWNRKTGAQIAWVSGRTGLPQIYTMESDGTNVQRLTEEGYAVSPSWSPNGQFLVFSWIRHYGPGAPGGDDIYLMDLASKRWVQLTHGGGRNDFPYWSPDGRHIIFQSTRSGSEQIWTMLADGTKHETANFFGRQFATKLELEIIRLYSFRL